MEGGTSPGATRAEEESVDWVMGGIGKWSGGVQKGVQDSHIRSGVLHDEEITCQLTVARFHVITDGAE